MVDALPSESDNSHEIGVPQWPLFPDVSVQHVNTFMFAINNSTDECEMALGRIKLPVALTPPEREGLGLDVEVVVRVVMTRTVLQEFARGVASAADLEVIVDEDASSV